MKKHLLIGLVAALAFTIVHASDEDNNKKGWSGTLQQNITDAGKAVATQAGNIKDSIKEKWDKTVNKDSINKGAQSLKDKLVSGWHKYIWNTKYKKQKIAAAAALLALISGIAARRSRFYADEDMGTLNRWNARLWRSVLGRFQPTIPMFGPQRSHVEDAILHMMSAGQYSDARLGDYEENDKKRIQGVLAGQFNENDAAYTIDAYNFHKNLKAQQKPSSSSSTAGGNTVNLV